jgi:hypothetical protein
MEMRGAKFKYNQHGICINPTVISIEGNKGVKAEIRLCERKGLWYCAYSYRGKMDEIGGGGYAPGPGSPKDDEYIRRSPLRQAFRNEHRAKIKAAKSLLEVFQSKHYPAPMLTVQRLKQIINPEVQLELNLFKEPKRNANRSIQG